MTDLGLDTKIDAMTGIADDNVGWATRVENILGDFRSDASGNPFGTAARANTGTASGNVPVLGSDAKLATGVIPNLSTSFITSGTLGVGRGGTGQTTLNGVKTWLGLDAGFDTLMGLDVAGNNDKVIGISNGNFAAVDAPSGGGSLTADITGGRLTLWSAATVPESSAARLVINRGSAVNYADAEFRWDETDQKFQFRIPAAATGASFNTYDVLHSGSPTSDFPFENSPLPAFPDQSVTQTNYVLRYTSSSRLQWDQDRSFILPSLRGTQDSFAFVRANQAGNQLTTISAGSVREAIGAVPCLTGGTTTINSSSTDLVVNTFNVVDSDAVSSYNLSSGGNFGSNEPGIGSRMAIVGKTDNTSLITVSLGSNAPGAANVKIAAGDVVYFEKCARTAIDGNGIWLVEGIVRSEDKVGMTAGAFDGTLNGSLSQSGNGITLRRGASNAGDAEITVVRGSGNTSARIDWDESERSFEFLLPTSNTGFGNVNHKILHAGSGVTDFATAVQNRFLPAPTSDTDDAGKVAALNSNANAYELVSAGGGGPTFLIFDAGVSGVSSLSLTNTYKVVPSITLPTINDNDLIKMTGRFQNYGALSCAITGSSWNSFSRTNANARSSVNNSAEGGDVNIINPNAPTRTYHRTATVFINRNTSDQLLMSVAVDNNYRIALVHLTVEIWPGALA